MPDREPESLGPPSDENRYDILYNCPQSTVWAYGRRVLKLLCAVPFLGVPLPPSRLVLCP